MMVNIFFLALNYNAFDSTQTAAWTFRAWPGTGQDSRWMHPAYPFFITTSIKIMRPKIAVI